MIRETFRASMALVQVSACLDQILGLIRQTMGIYAVAGPAVDPEQDTFCLLMDRCYHEIREYSIILAKESVRLLKESATDLDNEEEPATLKMPDPA